MGNKQPKKLLTVPESTPENSILPDIFKPDQDVGKSYRSDYLPELILLSYRYDPNSILKIFPPEIIYYIIDFMKTQIIEFEFTVNTSLEHNKYLNGSKFPYSIQSSSLQKGTYLFIILTNLFIDSLPFILILFSLGKNVYDKVCVL
jgi:hypothetical protein